MFFNRKVSDNMFFKKNYKEKPLNYWEEKSVMLALPKDNNNDFLKDYLIEFQK